MGTSLAGALRAFGLGVALLSASAVMSEAQQPRREPRCWFNCNRTPAQPVYRFGLTHAPAPPTTVNAESGDYYIELMPRIEGVDGIQNADCTNLGFARGLASLINRRKFAIALSVRIMPTSIGQNVTTVPDSVPRIPLYVIYYDETAPAATERCRIARFERPLSALVRQDPTTAYIVAPEFLVANEPNFGLFSNIAGLLDAFNVLPVDAAVNSQARELDRNLGTMFGGRQGDYTSFRMSTQGDERARIMTAVYTDTRTNAPQNVALTARLELRPRLTALRSDTDRMPGLVDMLSLRPLRVGDAVRDTVSGMPKTFEMLYREGRFGIRPTHLPTEATPLPQWATFGVECVETRNTLRDSYGLTTSDANLVVLSIITQYAPLYFKGDARNIYAPCISRERARTLLQQAGRAEDQHYVGTGPSDDRMRAVAMVMRPLIRSLYIPETAATPGRVPTIEEFRQTWTAILGDGLDTFVVIDERRGAASRVELTGAPAIEYLARYRGTEFHTYNAKDGMPLEDGVISAIRPVFDGRSARADGGIIVQSAGTIDADYRFTRIRIVESYDVAMTTIGQAAR